MEFFFIIVFPILLLTLIFGIIPSRKKRKMRQQEYEDFRSFIRKNGMYYYESATYKNIVEMNIDSTHRELALYSYFESVSAILKFDEVLDFEVEKNGNSIISSRMGSTIAGGIFFGGLGAMAGASGSRSIDKKCSTLKLKIYTNNISDSVIVLDFLEDEIYEGSSKYEEIIDAINKMIGFLKIARENNRQKERKEDKKVIVENVDDIKTDNDNFSQLEKLAELKEKGIITEQEFEEGKKKILSKL